MSVDPVTRSNGKRAYKVRFRDHSGKAKSETYDVKADALARDAAIRQAKQRKEPIPTRGRGGNGQTFGAFALDEWWPQDVIGRRLAQKTQDWYADLLDGHLIPRVGGDALAFIDVERVIALRAELAADGVPDYTSARVLKLFRQILEFAVLKRRLPYNPAAVLSGRKALPSQKRMSDVRPIPPEQTEALRRAILRSRSPHKLRDATLVSLIAYAGLRPEEALALKWQNVHDDTLRVEFANADGEVGKTKTEARRTVPMIPALADDLKAWRKTQSKPKGGDLVIAQTDGAPWSKTDYGNFRARVFHKHLPDDAHDGARVYDLRHGYASLLVREGCDLATVARRMGNSPRTTAQHYTHVFEVYEGKPRRTLAQTVEQARRGHLQDTSATDTHGHAGMPKAA